MAPIPGTPWLRHHHHQPRAREAVHGRGPGRYRARMRPQATHTQGRQSAPPGEALLGALPRTTLPGPSTVFKKRCLSTRHGQQLKKLQHLGLSRRRPGWSAAPTVLPSRAGVATDWLQQPLQPVGLRRRRHGWSALTTFSPLQQLGVPPTHSSAPLSQRGPRPPPPAAAPARQRRQRLPSAPPPRQCPSTAPACAPARARVCPASGSVNPSRPKTLETTRNENKGNENKENRSRKREQRKREQRKREQRKREQRKRGQRGRKTRRAPLGEALLDAPDDIVLPTVGEARGGGGGH